MINGDVPVELAYPFLGSNPEINPMGERNKVFVPYCTGDTYLGSRVQTYVDPEGVGPDVEFHHMGHQNMLLVIEELNEMFASVPKMMVGGCSAGGVGSLNNYPFIRNGIEGADKSYLIADSGPIAPGTHTDGEPSNQRSLSAVASVWGADTLIQSLPMGAGRTEIYRLASEDLEALRAQLDGLDNLAYYMPYYRNTNTSHCLTVTGLEDVGNSELEFIGAFRDDPSTATWAGTEIETGESTVTFKDFIEQVLDDSAPLVSYYEGTCEGRYQVCALDCEAYDEAMCESAVQ